jgi:hypothetical protein
LHRQVTGFEDWRGCGAIGSINIEVEAEDSMSIGTGGEVIPEIGDRVLQNLVNGDSDCGGLGSIYKPW